jgi:hypothetical protein
MEILYGGILKFFKLAMGNAESGMRIWLMIKIPHSTFRTQHWTDSAFGYLI